MSRKLPKKSEVVTGVNWDEVRKILDNQEWEPDDDNDGERRCVYLGTVFGLYPSGKYYMPFACSNLDPCPACNGAGQFRPVKARVWKKWKHAEDHARSMAIRRHYVGHPELIDRCGWGRYYRYVQRRSSNLTCKLCEGLGCLEALLDQIYQEKLDKEAEQHGCYVFSGEGDPCDIFIGEYRDTEVEEEEEEHVHS